MTGHYVNCGKCVECLKSKQRNWFARFWCEERYQKRVNPKSLTLFITFTYDEANLAKTRENALNDFRALVKKIKRHWKGCPVRYYAVTENGSLKGRLHFHTLFFGIDLNLFNELPDKVFAKFWTKGFIECEIATTRTFHYVSKYVTKDLDVSPLSEEEKWKPLVLSSRHPALGVPFFTNAHISYYNHNSDKLFIIVNGYKYSLPRYYRELLLNDENLFFSKTHSRYADQTEQKRLKAEKLANSIKNLYSLKKLKNKYVREQRKNSD